MHHIVCDDDCVDKLMTNLKVIGKIGPGFKIDTKGKYLKLDDTTYWQGATRWYRGDSRDTMYEKVHSNILSSLKIINMAINDNISNPDTPLTIYNNVSPTDFLVTMHDILKNTRIGLENLRDTYNADSTLTSRLEMDIISVQNQVALILKNVNLNENNITRRKLTDDHSVGSLRGMSFDTSI